MTRQVVVRGLHARLFHRFGRESVTLDGIFVGKTLGSRELIHTVVGLRRHDVVAYFEHFPLFGADERSGLVAVFEVATGFSAEFFYQFSSVERLCVHGHQRAHAVAAMNVEHLSDGPQSVRGINITTEIFVVAQSPTQFVVGILLPIVSPKG